MLCTASSTAFFPTNFKSRGFFSADLELIGALLPPERGRWARPARDNEHFLNRVLPVLWVGCPWPDMHERYGKWNSVYVRFQRWARQSVWEACVRCDRSFFCNFTFEAPFKLKATVSLAAGEPLDLRKVDGF